MSERDNLMMFAMLLFAGALAGGFVTWRAREADDPRNFKIAGALTALALIGALVAWFARPGFDSIEERVTEQLAGGQKPGDGPTGVITPSSAATKGGAQICVVDVERSRITSSETSDVPFDWSSDGCVNGRTQYGLANGKWSRIFVPGTEAAVSVNSYDPDTREYRVERYLLEHDAMGQLRKARAGFEAPQCGAGEGAARQFGSDQAAIMALLPAQPNERLVYNCNKAG
jgi:hypothetical protein